MAVATHALPHNVVPAGHPHAPPPAVLAHCAPVAVHDPHAAPEAPHRAVDWTENGSHVVPLQQPLGHAL